MEQGSQWDMYQAAFSELSSGTYWSWPASIVPQRTLVWNWRLNGNLMSAIKGGILEYNLAHSHATAPWTPLIDYLDLLVIPFAGRQRRDHRASSSPPALDSRSPWLSQWGPSCPSLWTCTWHGESWAGFCTSSSSRWPSAGRPAGPSFAVIKDDRGIEVAQLVLQVQGLLHIIMGATKTDESHIVTELTCLTRTWLSARETSGSLLGTGFPFQLLQCRLQIKGYENLQFFER